MSKPTSTQRLIELFRVLSDPTRMEIARLLTASDEVACTLLEDRLGLAKSTISYHIKMFRFAGLISVRKEGTFFHYRLIAEPWEELVPGVLDQLADLDPSEFLPASAAAPTS